jgi:hypothetical protein
VARLGYFMRMDISQKVKIYSTVLCPSQNILPIFHQRIQTQNLLKHPDGPGRFGRQKIPHTLLQLPNQTQPQTTGLWRMSLRKSKLRTATIIYTHVNNHPSYTMNPSLFMTQLIPCYLPLHQLKTTQPFLHAPLSPP